MGKSCHMCHEFRESRERTERLLHSWQFPRVGGRKQYRATPGMTPLCHTETVPSYLALCLTPEAQNPEPPDEGGESWVALGFVLLSIRTRS
jgi:hypothetical protein